MEAERGSISKKLRFEIFKRDNFACQYCGAKPPDVILELDHIVPVVAGGVSEIPNLITSCKNCNLGKGARTLEGKISRDDVALDVSDLEEKKEQLLAYYRYQKELAELARLNVSIVHEYFEQYEVYLSPQDDASIKTFLRYFTPVDLMEFVDLAVSRTNRANNQWRYFCGIAWAKIREAQEKSS